MHVTLFLLGCCVTTGHFPWCCGAARISDISETQRGASPALNPYNWAGINAIDALCGRDTAPRLGTSVIPASSGGWSPRGDSMSQKATRLTTDSGEDDRDIAEPGLGRGEPREIREEFEARLRFETLIADLSSEFVDVPPADVDRLIKDAQRRVCQCLDIDLAGLWQWSAEEPGFLGLTHLYRSEEGPPTPDPMDAAEYFPWCLQQLLAGKVIAVPSVEEMPPEAARDREVFRHFHIQSTLVIPLAAGGGPLIGALGFNATKAERVWPDAIVKRLRIIAEIFANAITRKRSDQVLRESEERLSMATVAAGLGVWAWDVPRDELWATENWRRMFGFPAEARLD